MSDATEPTLRDVIDRLETIDARLETIDARLDGISLDVNGLLTRTDDFERAATDTIRDGLAKVQAAVENFATTKADRAEVVDLRADVDKLREATG